MEDKSVTEPTKAEQIEAARAHRERWLQKVRDNRSKLRQLVADWHPSARFPKPLQRESVLMADGTAVVVDQTPMTITAPNAERACQVVREKIRQEQPANPVTKFDLAVNSGDVGGIMSLLDGAWFGVPESTSCWGIEGFSEAVDLLGDPPDPTEEEMKQMEREGGDSGCTDSGN